LIVADPRGEHDERARVVERDPRGLVDDLPVDVRPEQPGGVGRVGLGGEGVPELRVYPGTAELAVVQVGGIARDEGVAAEQRAEEVPWRGVILIPVELADLNLVARIVDRIPVGLRAGKWPARPRTQPVMRPDRTVRSPPGPGRWPVFG
jgi:hypothetical protein